MFYSLVQVSEPPAIPCNVHSFWSLQEFGEQVVIEKLCFLLWKQLMKSIHATVLRLLHKPLQLLAPFSFQGLLLVFVIMMRWNPGSCKVAEKKMTLVIKNFCTHCWYSLSNIKIVNNIIYCSWKLVFLVFSPSEPNQGLTAARPFSCIAFFRFWLQYLDQIRVHWGIWLMHQFQCLQRNRIQYTD